MTIISKERGLGKTTDAIIESVKTGYPIIVANSGMKRAILDKGYTNVYTLSEFQKLPPHLKPKSVIVDEFEYILSQLLGATPQTVTCTANINITTFDENIDYKAVSSQITDYMLEQIRNYKFKKQSL